MSAKIYQGKNTYSSDQIANIQGDRLTDSEMEKVIYLLTKKQLNIKRLLLTRCCQKRG